MAQRSGEFSGRLLIVAFEGWNDAGETASGVVRALKDLLPVQSLAQVDAERYFDYQFNRPMATIGDDGNRTLVWPSVTMYGPAPVRGRRPRRAHSSDADATTVSGSLADDAGLSVSGTNTSNVFLLLGTEPARSWQGFTAEIMTAITENKITAVIMLGAMLADVPHTRPISIHVSSENAAVRTELGVERSSYEGPVGILSVIGAAAEKAGIPTVSIWASVPHYVHNAPSPKAMLAMIDRLEELIDVVIPRGNLVEESAAWESGINALAGEDDDMANYIEQLEQARDTVDSPEASGEAIAQEFERYLRKRDGKADGRDRPQG